MRAGMSPELEELLRRPDPEAYIILEAEAVTAEHYRQDRAGWLEDDTGFATGFEILADGSLALTGTLSTRFAVATHTAIHTPLPGPPAQTPPSPFRVMRTIWGNSDDPDDLRVSRVGIHLDPDTGGGQNVATWFVQMFALERVDDSGLTSELVLVPLHAPVGVAAGPAAGNVLFDLAGSGRAPLPRSMGIPANGGSTYYAPTTFLFLWAVQLDGAPATNAAVRADSGITTQDNSGNIAQAFLLDRNVNGTYLLQTPQNHWRWSLEVGAFVSATITFVTNPFDLGVAPVAGDIVEFVGDLELPAGTSATLEARNDADTAWVPFLSRQTTDDLAGVTPAQTRDMRATLTTDATGALTPILRRFGRTALQRTDLTDVVELSGGGSRLDPVEMRTSIGSALLVANFDGEGRDFLTAIEELLTVTDLADLRFVAYVGNRTILARDKWLHLEDFTVDDSTGFEDRLELELVSPLAELRQELPKLTSQDREKLVYTNVSLATAYADLLDNQLTLGGRALGPRVEDTTTLVATEITDSDGKEQLDAIAALAGGVVRVSQGAIAFIPIHGVEEPIRHVFTLEEIDPVFSTPGWRQRVPDYRVDYDFDFENNRFDGEVRRFHAATITKVSRGRIDGIKRLRNTVAKWITTSALATLMAKRTVESLGTGMLTLAFRSLFAYPELEVGDLVAVQTSTFVAKDPNTDRALKGELFALGRIQQSDDLMGTMFSVWPRGYADIGSSVEEITKKNFRTPTVTALVPAIAGSGDLSAVAMTLQARAVRIAGSNTDYPDAAAVGAAPLIITDASGDATSGTLVTLLEGEIGYVSAIAYEFADGTGNLSAVHKARAIEDSNHETIPTAVDDGFSATRNAAAPENGDVTLTLEGAIAYSNLEDATARAASYTCAFDVDATGMVGDNQVTLSFYTSDSPTSTNWALVATKRYNMGVNLTDETVGFVATLGADFDIRVIITYNDAPGLDVAQVVMHGENNTLPGVQYAATGLKTIGDRYVLPAGTNLWAVT